MAGEIQLHFGHPPGIDPGREFPDYEALNAAGVHRPTTAGIGYRKDQGADSIVLNGGYEDDEDYGTEVIYTGQGGRSNSGAQAAHQQWERGNRALQVNQESGRPVRLIRGFKGDPDYSPDIGYRYDGLYHVIDSWMAVGRSGFDVCRFRLRQDSAEASPAVQQVRETKTRTTPPEIRRAVELRAMAVTEAHFAQLGFRVEDVSGQRPYDLLATDGEEELHIEVKGRSSATDTVELTANEVEAANEYHDAVLAVVDGIDWSRNDDGTIEADGGHLRVWLRWSPDTDALSPTQFRLTLDDSSDW